MFLVLRRLIIPKLALAPALLRALQAVYPARSVLRAFARAQIGTEVLCR